MKTEESLRFLGLARRAGKLALGEDQTRQMVRSGKAKLLLLASDAGANAAKRAEELSERKKLPILRLEADKQMFAEAFGTAPFALAALCDEGFAEALKKKLQNRE